MPDGEPPRQPGRFVVLEGIDGCGKSTQLEHLAAWLPSSGLLAPGARVVCTREPGGTALGAALRQLLLHPPEQAAPCSTAELLLYAADRAQHVERCVRPALAAGHWVLSDRYTGSTLAYQGYGRGLDRAALEQLEALATAAGGPPLRPHLTLWFDLPLAAALARRGGRPADRIEASGAAFLERVAAGFRELAGLRGWQRVDATPPAAAVSQACQRHLRALADG